MSKTSTTNIKRRTLPKALGLTVLGTAVLLGGPATLAGWHDSQQISTETITAGSMNLALSDKVWTLNGTAVPEADKAAVKLAPGDVLVMTTTAKPTLVGSSLKAKLEVVGMSASGTLLNPVKAAAYTWTAGGAAGVAKHITSASGSGVDVPIVFTVTMKPIGDPVYSGAGGTLGQGTTLDLSKITASLVQTP